MASFDKQMEALPELKGALEADAEGWALLRKLFDIGMSRVFEKYLPDLQPGAASTFLEELRRLDFDHLRAHRAALSVAESEDVYSDYESVRADADQEQYDEADEKSGRLSLEQGLWAVVVFNGGAGTRFFKEWNLIAEAIDNPSERWIEDPPDREDPKGVFPISPVMGMTFIERILAETLAIALDCGRLPPVLLMTSSVTHERTRQWLDEQDLWNYPKEQIKLFRQGEIPRLDEDGDLIVTAAGRFIWTGDGHGGIYAALANDEGPDQSLLSSLQQGGVRHIVMGNVDNAAFSPLAPGRLGYHLRKKSAFTLTVVERTDPEEKVGMTARRMDNGRVDVIEYSVLDPELSAKPAPDGGLLFDGAHINSNLLALEALRSDLPGTLYTNKGITLENRQIASSTYEMLNQHLSALLEADAVHVYQADRENYFLPTKALVGRDSVQSTVRALLEISRRTLKNLGAQVDDSAHVEWHPLLGMNENQLTECGMAKGWRLEAGSRLFLCLRYSVGDESPLSAGLHLQEGASFIIKVEQACGELRFDPSTRKIAEHPESAGRVSIGENLTLSKGVRLAIRVEGDGSLEIKPGWTCRESSQLIVKAGEVWVLGDDNLP